MRSDLTQKVITAATLESMWELQILEKVDSTCVRELIVRNLLNAGVPAATRAAIEDAIPTTRVAMLRDTNVSPRGHSHVIRS
jgi:hypothetical protein